MNIEPEEIDRVYRIRPGYRGKDEKVLNVIFIYWQPAPTWWKGIE